MGDDEKRSGSGAKTAGVVERVFSYTDWNAVRGGSTVTAYTSVEPNFRPPGSRLEG
jgi:hypothetical protein